MIHIPSAQTNRNLVQVGFANFRAIHSMKYCYFYNMKNVLLSILIASGMFTAEAKDKFGFDTGIGVKAGLNFNKVVSSEWKDRYSTDPHAGIFAYVNRYRLGLQIEALWTQNSITTDSSFYGLYQQYYNQANDSIKNGTFRFSTISIPILLNIKLAQFLWLQGGPQYSANVQVIDKDKILKSGVDIIQSGNFNLVGGIWMQFGSKNASVHPNIGIRYISGINNMSNLNTITGDESEWKNQMIQLHIGLSF